MQSTILVVDDDDDIRDIVIELVREAGHLALSARNGAEALRILRTKPTIALVLLDLMMPVLDGYDCRAQQLADPSIAHIPVVVMTAFCDVDQARIAAPVLTKPVAYEVLLATLAHVGRM